MASAGATVSVKIQWLDAAGDRPCLAVVRRGDDATFRFLQEQAVRRSNVAICWDRRVQDRRSVAQAILPERRSRDRRRAPPESWRSMGFVMAPRPDGAPPPPPVAGPSRLSPLVVSPGRAGSPGSDRPPAASGRPGETNARPVRAADSRLAHVVALVEMPHGLLPAFHDPATPGWRCPGCDMVLALSGSNHGLPRPGAYCLTCRGRVIRVLQHPWQRVNWLTLAAVAGGGFLTLRTVGSWIIRLL